MSWPRDVRGHHTPTPSRRPRQPQSLHVHIERGAFIHRGTLIGERVLRVLDRDLGIRAELTYRNGKDSRCFGHQSRSFCGRHCRWSRRTFGHLSAVSAFAHKNSSGFKLAISPRNRARRKPKIAGQLANGG